MTPLEAALSYLARGWSVIPGHSIDPDGICTCTRIDCDSVAKHPRVGWIQYQTARPSEFQVRAWWQRWPNANVIVVTGAISRLVVVDVDPRHGGDESLRDLSPTLPDTIVCLTGGGGQHYYFQYPGPVRSGAGILHGIDLRGDGGYVVAPPSTHASSQPYLWQIGAEPEAQALAHVPAWLLPILLRFQGSPNGQVKEPETITLLPFLTGEQRLTEGERNQRLTQFAGHLLASGNSIEATLGTLLHIAGMAEPPLALPDVQRIVRSIHNREERRRAATESAAHLDLTELSSMGDQQRLELARAVWSELGIHLVGDWVQVSGAGETDYQVELPDRVVSVGPALLGGYTHVRDVLLSAHAGLLLRMRMDRWDTYALRLSQLAREQSVGPLRQTEQLAEWIEEYAEGAIEYPPGPRHDALRSHAIIYEGQLATRIRPLTVWIERTTSEKLTGKAVAKMLRLAGWEYRSLRTAEDKWQKAWVHPLTDADNNG